MLHHISARKKRSCSITPTRNTNSTGSSLSGLKHELAELGPSTVLSVRTTQVVIDWIVVHILQTDKRLGT